LVFDIGYLEQRTAYGKSTDWLTQTLLG